MLLDFETKITLTKLDFADSVVVYIYRSLRIDRINLHLHDIIFLQSSGAMKRSLKQHFSAKVGAQFSAPIGWQF